MPDSNFPYTPPITPYNLPETPFDTVIGAFGINLIYQKAHDCPCVFGGPITGSPDPLCITCHGRGIYWDRPGVPFVGMITFIHAVTSSDEPGSVLNPEFGMVQRGEPLLSIPASAPSGIWAGASLEDAFVEKDATMRFRTTLRVGGNTLLPYQQSLAVAASGAVTTYNMVTHSVDPISAYTVSGGSVVVSGYPTGTYYTVEYTAAPVYVAWRPAGSMPHIRPLGQGVVNLPRRFKLAQLDLWLRTKFGGVSPNST